MTNKISPLVNIISNTNLTDSEKKVRNQLSVDDLENIDLNNLESFFNCYNNKFIDGIISYSIKKAKECFNILENEKYFDRHTFNDFIYWVNNIYETILHSHKNVEMDANSLKGIEFTQGAEALFAISNNLLAIANSLKVNINYAVSSFDKLSNLLYHEAINSKIDIDINLIKNINDKRLVNDFDFKNIIKRIYSNNQYSDVLKETDGDKMMAIKL